VTADAGGDLEQTLIAATLVSASLAVLFVVWQNGVNRALAVEKNRGGADNINDGPARATVRSALIFRSLPLFATSAATFGVLLLQLCPTLREAWHCIGARCGLDHVKALAVINSVVVGLLTFGLLGQLCALCKKLRTLGQFNYQTYVAKREAKKAAQTETPKR